MTSFFLKLIAMITMTVDHIGVLLCDGNTLLRIIGRLAFLTYAFLMAEGYYHLKNKPERLNAHILKLFVLALVTEVTHDLCAHRVWLEFSSQNAVFTLLLGFLMLIACGLWTEAHRENKAVSSAGCALIVLAVCVVSWLIRSEYPISGPLFIGMSYLYLCRADTWKLPKRLLVLLGISAAYLTIHLWVTADFGGLEAIRAVTQKRLYLLFSPIVIVPLALYNRKIGYRAKWFGWLYSCFYPLQFTVFALILYLTGR